MKYSKIFKIKHRNFRYNFDNSTLEYITNIQFDDETFEAFESDVWEVLDSIGLSLESWENEQQHYLLEYNSEIEEHVHLFQNW